LRLIWIRWPPLLKEGERGEVRTSLKGREDYFFSGEALPLSGFLCFVFMLDTIEWKYE